MLSCSILGCGTGAYLLEVARCIAEDLRRQGDTDVIGLELLKAFENRVIGFEILTAPFAIAQLQTVHTACRAGCRASQRPQAVHFLDERPNRMARRCRYQAQLSRDARRIRRVPGGQAIHKGDRCAWKSSI